jgi:hypothetical protein
MTAVYSTLLIAAGGVGVDASYVVPAGCTVVVRDIALFFEELPEDTIAVVWDPATGCTVFYALQTDTNQYSQWHGHQVFPAGSTVNAKSAGPNYTVIRVSGYLLSA